ncbi:MAG: serine protease [Bacteroidota bacterium]
MNIQWINSGISRAGFDWQAGSIIDVNTGRPQEAVLGPENFKQIGWLERAIEASRKVARIKMRGGSATGFMISDDILITNNHVFESKGDTISAKIQFNYKMDISDNPVRPDVWECDGNSLFKTNPDLDYSIVKLKTKRGRPAGNVWGYFDVSNKVPVKEKQRVNIIQHPQGRFKEIAFRDNQVRAVSTTYVQYITDTDYGSSGSPVMDDWFDVVALHNQRVRDPQAPHQWYRNQGFLMSEIYNEIKAHL